MKPTNPATTVVCLAFGLLCFLSLNTATVQAQQVQVNAADPPAAAQGTINLNVKVTGKGFKNGAISKFSVTGTTDPGGVTVNSTTFVSGNELTANITVADTAVIANFDIQVTNSDGRGGKGTELFSVTPKGGGGAGAGSNCPPMLPVPNSDTKCYGASPGCLDTTFGTFGFATLDPDTPTYSSIATAVVIQPDGKTIAAGQAVNYLNGTGADFLVVRYNIDGSLDTSFGTPDPFNPSLRLGYVLTPFSAGFDLAEAVILQPDGKIVVAGSAGGFAVVRYNTDGTLDTTFGSGGKTIVSFASAASVRGLVIQSDGKLILAGSAGSPSQFGLARLNANGSLDSTFGTGGKVVANPSNVKRGNGIGWTIALQRIPAVMGEERIVMGGWGTTNLLGGSSVSTFTVMRFKPDGSIDSTFGSSGRAYVPFFGFGDQIRRIAIDSANRIVAAGIVRTGSDSCGSYAVDYGVVRLTENGGLDTSFGGGRQTADIYGGNDNLYGLVLQPDGRIVVSGSASSSDGSVRHFVLVRLNDNGTRDSSFGLLSNGMVTTDFYGYGDFGMAVALQPADGKIVFVGSIYLQPTIGDIGVARYWP